jgi:hypothetical protein
MACLSIIRKHLDIYQGRKLGLIEDNIQVNDEHCVDFAIIEVGPYCDIGVLGLEVS